MKITGYPPNNITAWKKHISGNYQNVQIPQPEIPTRIYVEVDREDYGLIKIEFIHTEAEAAKKLIENFANRNNLMYDYIEAERTGDLTIVDVITHLR
jgi:hypothetical protein